MWVSLFFIRSSSNLVKQTVAPVTARRFMTQCPVERPGNTESAHRKRFVAEQTRIYLSGRSQSQPIAPVALSPLSPHDFPELASGQIHPPDVPDFEAFLFAKGANLPGRGFVHRFCDHAVQLDSAEARLPRRINAVQHLSEFPASGIPEKFRFIHCIKADVQPVKPGGSERTGKFPQLCPVGGHPQVVDAIYPGQLLHQRDNPPAQEGFTAGQPHFANAMFHPIRHHGLNFFKAENVTGTKVGRVIQ
jgi:hypothetical protein